MGSKRDILKELRQASKQAGLKFGVSSHFAFNWGYYNHQDRFDTGNPELVDLYGAAHKGYAQASEVFKELWWKRTSDIIDNYTPDIRFTSKGDVLYATVLDYSAAGNFVIKYLAKENPNEARPIKMISFISGENKINWEQTAEGLKIQLEGQQNCTLAFVFKVEF